MEESEDIITVLDILDIDEDIIDYKVNNIINKKTHNITSKQWKTLVILIKYKILLNQKEETDCDNRDIVQNILTHILKLEDDCENFAILLEAFKVSLRLCEDNLINLSEHFIRQLLSSTEILEKKTSYSNVINTILNVCIESKLYISSRFLLDDVEKLIKNSENNPSLLNIVPKIIAVSGEPFVLNRIWDFIVSKPRDNHDYTILCTLSDYYFSSERSKSLNMLSTLTKSLEFWMLIRHGFADDDIYARKCSIYLAKRAVNTICESEHPVIVNFEDDPEDSEPLVHYDPKNVSKFENDWKDLFALLEILEEKQYRLVEPAMRLFSQMNSLHDIWICCALTRALNHDIESVKSMAIEVTLSLSLSWKRFPIETLLNALNNVYIYENIQINTLIESIKKFLAHDDNLIRVVKCLRKIPWSPIPKFYVIYSMFSMRDTKVNLNLMESIEYLCSESTKMNNSCIQEAVDICLFNFIIKNATGSIKTNDLISLMEKFKNIMVRNSATWRIYLEWIRINDKESLTIDGLKNYESFAKYCYCLKETEMISEADFEKFIDNAFEILKQSTYREYASKDEFVSWFSYISSTIECMDDGDENTKIKIINNVETIYCFLKHFVLNIEEYPESNNITNGLQIMIQNQWFCDNTTHFVKNFCDDLISSFLTTMSSNYQKYFCVKILSILASPANSVISDLIFRKTFFEWDENSNGKINCDYYEALSKLYNNILNQRTDFDESEIGILYSAVDDFLEIGGYNCIIFAINLFKIIYSRTFEYKGCEACENIFRLIWKNIFDIRKSDQFRTCIRAFITLLFVINNEIVMKYISELFLLGELSPNVILELVNYVSLNKNKINEKHVNLILSKAVVFGNIFRKDQRVESEVCLFIQRQKLFHAEKNFIPYITTTIRKNAVNCIERSRTISAEVAKQINELLQETKIKTRYHDNTTHHRILLRSMQLLLLDQKFYLNEKISIDLKWFLDLLKNPNPSSVKILIEWFIILQIIREITELEETITKYDMFDLPQISLFTIVYHVVKYQIGKQNLTENMDCIVKKNLIFALTLFSSNTMGSLFNVRLYSQYLMNELLNLTKDSEICKKYAIMKETLPKILSQMEDEKNMKKIKNDFYINKFDPIRNLTVFDLYYNFPKLYDVSKDEWICFAPDDSDFNNFNLNSGETNVKNISMVDNSIVQKKFLPSKPLLGDLQLPVKEISEPDKLAASKKLIVVASLIDKLPNLGGLSRTCEVFGVKQYVISSLRHVQDKQFQSVSVSAENWLDIIEIQPGNPLKEYLIEKKSQGYCIIGAEQTSSSSSLHGFKFPEKSLILLGHEKEGVPCDLLNLMDHCVEVPQYGLIRSLNVHVTASIFIWEYQKQHRR